MDATLLKFDAVRSALALVAFGVIGCLAWFRGDANLEARSLDRGTPAEVHAAVRQARP